jgi:hypothetical protein
MVPRCTEDAQAWVLENLKKRPYGDVGKETVTTVGLIHALCLSYFRITLLILLQDVIGKRL